MTSLDRQSSIAAKHRIHRQLRSVFFCLLLDASDRLHDHEDSTRAAVRAATLWRPTLELCEAACRFRK